MAAANGGAPRLKISADRLLLVEGRDEANLFGALLRHCLGAVWQQEIQIVEAGGRNAFRGNVATIRAEAESRPLRVIGVVRDADRDARGALQSVCNALRMAGYNPPAIHGDVSNGNPRVGVFIVPDGRAPGAIETLCRRSVAGRAAGDCVEAFIDCLKEQGTLHSRNEDKTFTHAWLAAGADPVARVGEGAQQGAWDFDSEAFGELTAFLRRLLA